MAQTGFGGATPGEATVVSAEDLRAEMRQLEITRALARIVPESLTEAPLELSSPVLLYW